MKGEDRTAKRKWYDGALTSTGLGTSTGKRSTADRIKKLKDFPVIGRWSFARRFVVLLAASVSAGLIAMFSYQYFAQNAGSDKARLDVLDQVSDSLPVLYGLTWTAIGDADMVPLLKAQELSMGRKLGGLTAAGMTGYAAESVSQNNMGAAWVELKSSVDVVVDNEQYLRQFSVVTREVQDFGAALLRGAGMKPPDAPEES